MTLATGDLEGPLWVDGDATRIAQVVGNLLQNALKFTGEGGRVEVAAGRAPGGARAWVRVRDDGAGIAPDLLARIFEPFTQGDTTIGRSQGGLGLGLAVGRGLVELHGGSITVESDGPGRGAAFTISLPLAEGPDERSEAVPSPRGARAARRVLVIDDNEDLASTLRELLELWGHTVTVAHAGREGLALARSLRPDVVLCDIGLPTMDGHAVARAIRAEPELAATRLVALSGFGSADDRERSRAAGFEDHLVKPPSVEALDLAVSGPSRP